MRQSTMRQRVSLLQMALLVGLLVCIAVTTAQAQRTSDRPIRVFGYFQNEWQYQRQPLGGFEANSFLAQQLNIMFQKDLAPKWRSFVNLEMTNNFSTSRQWGDFELSEAWIRYRDCERFSLKLGLQLPKFNYLNEIKNRTPLLPYILRPMVYETSFKEVLTLDEFVPHQAYVQAYGFLPYQEAKFEWAAYIGNSPNINADSSRGVTGFDSSSTILLGGRAGLLYKELRLGFSITYDQYNYLAELRQILGGDEARFKELGRTRLGTDLGYRWWVLSLEAEGIYVRYDDDLPQESIDLKFAYYTLGVHPTERSMVYTGGWFMWENGIDVFMDEQALPQDTVYVVGDSEQRILGLTFGASYWLNDRIALKAQYLKAWQRMSLPEGEEHERYTFIAVAISTWF